MSMLIKVYYESAGVPATGLSPIVNIRNLSTYATVVVGGTMEEVGDGYYVYDHIGYDYAVPYSVLCDANTTTLADTDRYVPGEYVNPGETSSVTGTSVVGLCNQALFMLGQKAIISMTEDSEAARLCNGRFTYNRDATLRAYPWNCATKRTSLARSATTPSWGYDYQYALPTSPLCLRVLELEEETASGYGWKIEGRWLLTDATTAYIRYIAQITDVNDMEILLKDAIATRLAADICYALTGSSTQQDKMWMLFEQKIRQAKSVDAQEGTPLVLFSDPFWDARL